MFNLTFYNERGTITFGGGSSNSNFKIIQTDGLSFCGKTYNSVSYYNCDGQETVSENMNPRVITLKGDFELGQNYQTELSSALAVLNKEGTVEVQTRYDSRRIKARCTDFVEGEKQGKFMPFTMQFICDDPYFESSSSYIVPLYRTVANISSDFTFPAPFSFRTTRRNIFVSSNAETEPVFYIDVGASPGGDIEIKNHTSGERLKLNYTPLANDYITVDVKNRRIYNQSGESIVHLLSDDSFFDGFHLYPGDNDVEVLIGSVNTTLDVTCRYNEKFLEAVF